MDATTSPGQVRYPFAEPPEAGTATEIAPGVLWMRLPLPMVLNHVNVFAFDDGDGWTLIDTGYDTAQSRATWEALLAGPLAGKPVRRVLLTHHHADHIGLAGWFAANGAEIVTSRTAWLFGRMLLLDVQETAAPESIAFWRAAGMPEAMIADRMAERPYNFSDYCAPIPLGYTRLTEGQTLRMGGRDWLVLMGDGHAPEHVTLWEQGGNLVVGGDQILPGISANIGVHATEPGADPIADWMAANARFAPHVRPDQLVLPGHKLPFTGLPMRLRQMVDNHHGALARLKKHLSTPRSACDCFVPLFGREITGSAYGLAMVEAVAHLNYLLRQGVVRRETTPEGVWLWQLA